VVTGRNKRRECD